MSPGRERPDRPLVLEAQPPGTVRVESPADESDLVRADRVAVVAHWDPAARVGRSPRTLTQASIQAGYLTILVSTAEGDSPLAWIDGRPSGVAVLRRPNLGYDFGSWATALDLLPAISRAP